MVDNARAKGSLGVTEFFVAKRAAVKLKAFWRRHTEQKQLEEAERKRKELEQKLAVKE